MARTTETYPFASVSPTLRRFFWTQETVQAGKSPTKTDTSWYRESFTDATITFARDRYTGAETDGKPTTMKTIMELTHHTDFTVTLPWRPNGFGAFAQASLCGNKDDTATTITVVPTGTGPTLKQVQTITPGVEGTLTNTFSLVMDSGAKDAARGDQSLLLTYATISSVNVSYGPGGVLMATVTGSAMYPANSYFQTAALAVPGYVPAPTAFTKISSKRIEGYRGSFKFFPHDAANASDYITSRITTGDFTFARDVAAFYTADQALQCPIAFDVGALSVNGNITFRFDNMKDKTAFAEWFFDSPSGTSTYPNEFSWTDGSTPGYGMTFDLYYLKFDLGFSDTATARELSGSWTAYDDETVDSLTTPISLVINTPTSVAMVY